MLNPFFKVPYIISVIILLIFILHGFVYANKPCKINQEPEFHLLDAELDNEFEWLRAETLVYSVNKIPENLFQIPAAVYKIDSEKICRSGALTIPDVLRLAPGTNVAQFNTSDWSVAVRGFTTELVNNLLVIMDGRTLYTPIFSGVYWNSVDALLEDIDSIEVIRGPGGTIWGANAVNGVVNIISKKVQDTQGMFMSYHAASSQVQTNLRYGGSLDAQRYYKFWIKALEHKNNIDNQMDLPDQKNWQAFRGGFRFDWDHSDTFASLEAGLSEENMMQDFYGMYYNAHIRERYIMSKVEKEFPDNSSIQLTAYYDHRVRNEMLYIIEKEDRFDIDFQHVFFLNPYNRLTWGLGYRYITDRIDPDSLFSFDRLSWSRSITSGFIQHKWSLAPDCFIIFLGSKFEYNEFTAFESQPSLKLLWLPSNTHAIWTSISKAVRTPARIDLNADMQFGYVYKKGNPDLESEVLTAYEIGYRTDAIKNIHIDVTAFYNVYDKLRRMASEDGYTIIADNQMNGETYGGEFVLNWNVLMNTRYIHKWTLTNSWSFIRLNMHQLDNKLSNTEILIEGNYPRNMVSCHSKMDIFDNLQFDLAIKYVEALSAYEIPTYIKTDCRLNYILSDNFQCQLIGQNIQDPEHPEYLSFELNRLLFVKFIIQY
jgi:iron complex outermembrane receptor protein